jgi:UDP-N-acetylmuramate--alanine ligase
MSHSQHLHAIGIGGIGVSALARHFLSLGWEVSGCDLSEFASLEGATVLHGHDPFHVDRFSPTMVVHSPALPDDHPELVRAKEKGIPVYSYPQALGLLAKSYEAIAVSGTHGKSTTTALLSLMFAEGGLDPVAIVGARVPAHGFEENYRKGDGKQFIVEGCEYRRGMLDIGPKSIVLTNIEADHLDYYKDLADIAGAFEEYARRLPQDGRLVYNADDPESVRIASSTKAMRHSFGLKDGDLRATDITSSSDGTRATIIHHGTTLGEIMTPLVGAFNIANILAAMSMALAYGVPFPAIVSALKGFKGIGRRFEYVGVLGSTEIYSDYAHHPTALRVAADAAEEKFGKGNVLVIFQPHQIDRTKKLRAEFESVMAGIPHLVLTEIYFVPGREHAGEFSAKLLVDSVNTHRTEPVRFVGSLDLLTPLIDASIGSYKAIVFTGAGDIDRYVRSVVKDRNHI